MMAVMDVSLRKGTERIRVQGCDQVDIEPLS